MQSILYGATTGHLPLSPVNALYYKLDASLAQVLSLCHLASAILALKRGACLLVASLQQRLGVARLSSLSSFPPTPLGYNARPPGGAFPYMRQHADTIAKAIVDRVFAAVPGLNTNLSARFAGAPLPGSLVPYQQAHKAALAAGREAHVRSLQNPPPPDPTIVVRAPPPSPVWVRAWAEAQGHVEAEMAVQKAEEDAYVRSMALNGWPSKPRHAP
jgi:hypothetical protein